MTSANLNRQQLTQLRKLLIQHFSLSELRVLCFDLGLEYEELAGDTKTTKMHGLIEYLQRRSELSRLLNEVIEQRPKVDWPSFGNKNSATETGKQAAKNFIHEKSGLDMMFIPASEFLCGSDNQPAFLPDFWISKTPVTNEHYAKFVESADYKAPKYWQDSKFPMELSRHPVTWVSWEDATAFAQWGGLQLPNEQQWEKAARGRDGRIFPWGKEWKPYCNTREDRFRATTPVGYYSSFGDSPYGCVDMVGNVWEWTNSWFDENQSFRILCGGSWNNDPQSVNVSSRFRYFPNLSYNDFGFRIILNPP